MRVAVLAVALCLTAACSSPEPEPDVEPSPSPSPAVLQAADGTDAGACGDGRCQIIVTGRADIDLGGKFTCHGIVVTYTAPDRVNLAVAVVDAEPVNAAITGTGNLRLAYGLTVTVETTTPAGAVVRMAPQQNDPRRHKGTGTKGFSLWSG